MLSHNASTKSQRYILLLDEARCRGNWDEVSRLKHKIAKHAPQRKCLQVTVATGLALSKQPLERPSTSSTLPPPDYSQHVSEIQTALKYGNPTAEDAFQAEVCLSWLYWTLNEPDLAISQLPGKLEDILDHLALEEGVIDGWTHVCIVKGAYIRGHCQEKAGNLFEAVQTYESILPYITRAKPSFSDMPQQRIWTQRLLSRHCMLSSQHVKSRSQTPKELLISSSLIAPAKLLAPFRAWDQFWEIKSDRNDGSLIAEADSGGVPRRLVWQAYYEVFSTLLGLESIHPFLSIKDHPFKDGSLYDSKFFIKHKPGQCAELIRIQSIYEKFLLLELRFPKANESTIEIEHFADQVVSNWNIMSGPTWRDEDHIDGGKRATGQLVLDILYQATSRTFHSTQILRQLFTIHTSISEFYLAGKALDSYFEIVTKAKARFEKSGESELGLDDDAMVLRTAAAGIVMLCFYGRRKEAERAQELAVILEKWLKRIYDDPAWNLEGSYNNVGQHSKRKAAARTLVLGQALASGFRALGICQARWANLTYETSTRADLQVKSISNLRIAVGPGLGNEDNIEVLYSLAMVYFQTRDIDSAMRVIKKALSIGVVDLGEEGGPNEGVESTSFLDTQKRRLLLKSWHLLALLLSAREKFSAAVTSCDAALELFRIRSKSPGQSQARRLIGNIDSCDMKSIIEVRMTQLALAEVVDGPEEAVNASQDLLGLYSRLFNYSEQPRSKPAVSASTSPPASRHETIRSFRGSFLGRSKDARIKSSGSGSAQRNLGSGSFVSQESPNAIARTPAISVTTVNTSSTKKGPHHSHHLFHHEPKKLHKRNNRSSEGSIKAPASSGFFQPPSGLPVQNPQNGMSQSIKPDELPPNESIDYTSEDVGVAISHDEPTSSPQSSAKQRTPPALSLPQLSPPHQQSCSSQSSPKTPTSPFQNKTTLSPSLPLLMHPSPPIPLFSSSDQKRQSLTLLIKIWLHIASLYRRASMPADASGALSEAQTHITSIEASVAATNASVEAFTTPGWGGMKSVSELWADALAEQARLHEMQGHRVEAEADYEKALTNCPDHPGAIVGLSNLLLDFYESPSPSPSSPPSQDPLTIPTTPLLASLPSPPPSSTLRSLPSPSSSPSSPSQSDLLPRLCARDRAYGLLSSLTKSGAGWDCAEAWFAFARALELGGQIAKAKKALWWVVELEENRPVRGWECLAF